MGRDNMFAGVTVNGLFVLEVLALWFLLMVGAAVALDLYNKRQDRKQASKPDDKYLY